MLPKTLEWCTELKEEKKKPNAAHQNGVQRARKKKKSLLYLVRVSEKKIKNERVTKR